MTNYKRRTLLARIAFAALILAILALCLTCVAEYSLRPIINDAAKSRARSFATETVNTAVVGALSDTPPLVEVRSGADGVSSVEVDIGALSTLRANAISSLTKTLSDDGAMRFSVPLGSLTGTALIAGRGTPIEIRLVRIGDVTADVYSEFIESGINQTLHRIFLRTHVTLNVLVVGKSVTIEHSSDVPLAETVIVGKVPDAYTAINRYEIDEEEENDLNDYAASLP